MGSLQKAPHPAKIRRVILVGTFSIPIGAIQGRRLDALSTQPVFGIPAHKRPGKPVKNDALRASARKAFRESRSLQAQAAAPFLGDLSPPAGAAAWALFSAPARQELKRTNGLV